MTSSRSVVAPTHQQSLLTKNHTQPPRACCSSEKPKCAHRSFRGCEQRQVLQVGGWADGHPSRASESPPFLIQRSLLRSRYSLMAPPSHMFPHCYITHCSAGIPRISTARSICHLCTNYFPRKTIANIDCYNSSKNEINLNL
jgi:hypothetical protein